MSNEQTPARPWWKLGAGTWLGILLLVPVSVMLLTGRIPFDRQIASWIVCSLDPHHWPLWISVLLWCAVLWKIGDLKMCPDALRQIIKPASVLIFLLAVGYQNNWHLATQRTKLYGQIYVPYIMGPLAGFIHNRRWDWRILILPTLALAVLSGLIVLLIRARRMTDEEKAKKSEQLRGQVVWFVVMVVVTVLLVQVPAWIPRTWKVDGAKIVHKLYMDSIVTPMTSLMATGYWDWKTFLFPGAGLLVLAGLLSLTVRLRKRKHETKTKEETT